MPGSDRPSDRPWTRHILRTGIRLFLGRRKAHYQDWMPGLSIRPGVGDEGQREVVYKGRPLVALRTIECLRQEAGPEIHIVGSGPSIRRMDMSRIAPRSAILLNGAIRLIGDGVAEPLAIAIEDERFIYRHFDGIMRRIAPGTICLLSVSVMRAICEHDRDWLCDKRVILIDNILKPYGMPRLSIEAVSDRDYVVIGEDHTGGGKVGLSLEPDQGVFQAGSVAVSALQFALACPVETIGFIGIDISNAAEPRFYEASNTAAFSGVALAEGRILAHIRLALALAQGKDIRFLNFSPVSALAKLDLKYDPRLTLGVDNGV